MRNESGFTLIELLIVVAIIGILAAIAIPNFLQAQVRAKVSKNNADFASVATALEMYAVDYSVYPGDCWETRGWKDEMLSRYVELTTPVDYLTSIPEDPFRTFWLYPDKHATYTYAGQWWQSVAGGGGLEFTSIWVLVGMGPDTFDNNGEWATVLNIAEEIRLMFLYDPTNGTVSSGDIVRWGP